MKDGISSDETSTDCPDVGHETVRPFVFREVRYRSASRRQDDPELRFAAQHSFVSLVGFFERICFNHRTHAGQFGETQCISIDITCCPPSMSPVAPVRVVLILM